MVVGALGRKKECKTHLERAVELRKYFIEAKRELRLMEMRNRKGAKGSGGKPDKGGKGKGKDKDKGGDREGRWPFGLDRLFKKKK